MTIKNVKHFCKKYNHALVLLYALVYMPWFTYLEKHVTEFYLIHSPLDDYIPFIEYFIVPYLLWFLFVAVSGIYLFFKDKKVFLQMSLFLILGMTVFLVTCTVFPNGTDLRPAVFARDNIFTHLVSYVYSVDTPTNVLPSMHVFVSLGTAIGLARTETLRKKPMVRGCAYTLATLIVLSTVFLKQHSLTDVVAGIALAVVLYQVIYVHETKHAHRFLDEPIL